MGAYSPAPVVTPNVHGRVMQEIVLPTIAGMAAEGMPFSGFLYAGLMIDKTGAPKVIGQPQQPRVVPSMIVLNAKGAKLQAGKLVLEGVSPNAII